MHSVKPVALCAFLLFSQAFAALGVTYRTTVRGGGLGGADKPERVMGEIPDDKGDLVVENMAAWSNNRFTASKYTPKSGGKETIIVQAVDTVNTKTEAVDSNNYAKRLVKSHVG